MPLAKAPELRASKQVHCFLPPDVVQDLDELANKRLLARSAYLRMLVMDAINEAKHREV